MTRKSTAIDAYVNGSVGFTATSMLAFSITPVSASARDEPDHRCRSPLNTEPFADHEAEDALARRAECHAYADLRRALADGRRQHAVETDRGENRGDGAEDPDEHEREARRRHGAIDVVAHRPHVADRHQRIDLGDDARGLSGISRIGITIRAHGPASRGAEAEHARRARTRLRDRARRVSDAAHAPRRR